MKWVFDEKLTSAKTAVPRGLLGQRGGWEWEFPLLCSGNCSSTRAEMLPWMGCSGWGHKTSLQPSAQGVQMEQLQGTIYSPVTKTSSVHCCCNRSWAPIQAPHPWQLSRLPVLFGQLSELFHQFSLRKAHRDSVDMKR